MSKVFLVVPYRLQGRPRLETAEIDSCIKLVLMRRSGGRRGNGSEGRLTDPKSELGRPC